jgi:hypothetical protein
VWCRPDYQSVQSAITVGTLFSEEGSMECGLVTLDPPKLLARSRTLPMDKGCGRNRSRDRIVYITAVRKSQPRSLVTVCKT